MIFFFSKILFWNSFNLSLGPGRGSELQTLHSPGTYVNMLFPAWEHYFHGFLR